MANDQSEFRTEGYKTANGSARVSIRWPGVTWGQPASYVLNKDQTIALIADLAVSLIEAEADDAIQEMDEVDPSPDCRCETCPQGGPYTCISTD